MDTLSHGLWGAAGFGRKNRQSFWTSFCFGVGPDLLSFGLFFLIRLLTPNTPLLYGPMDPDMFPGYLYGLYNVTHSFVVFLAVFLVVFWFRGKPLWEMLAWPLHILFDIFTHSASFFPTPFLWPLSSYTFSGIMWHDPRIFIPNVVLLIGLYVWFFVIRRRKRKRPLQEGGIFTP